MTKTYREFDIVTTVHFQELRTEILSAPRDPTNLCKTNAQEQEEHWKNDGELIRMLNGLQ